MKPKYLVIDTETGGLDPQEHSLLSIAGVIWVPGEEPRKSFDFLVKEPLITVQPEALVVNGLDLSVLSEQGLTPKEGIAKIKGALFDEFGDRGVNGLVPLAGHNVGFDIAFLKRMYRLAGNDDYAGDFSHRSLDTSSILTFLMCGKHLPFDKPKSDFLFEFCGVQPKTELRHTALGDAWATAEALNVLIEKFGVQNA